MKKGLLFSMLTAFLLPLSAQPVSRLYVFSREFYPGMVRQRDIPSENNGSITRPPDSVIQYFIYAGLNGKLVPGFRKIWLKGKWYSIHQTEKINSPVYSSPPDPKQLIPEGKQTIVRIIPGKLFPRKAASFPALQRMMNQQEVILCYQWNGKYYYYPVQTITLLDPVFSE
jgi:hypothetical protein